MRMYSWAPVCRSVRSPRPHSFFVGSNPGGGSMPSCASDATLPSARSRMTWRATDSGTGLPTCTCWPATAAWRTSAMLSGSFLARSDSSSAVVASRTWRMNASRCAGASGPFLLSQPASPATATSVRMRA